jgi:hypothetical protein
VLVVFAPARATEAAETVVIPSTVTPGVEAMTVALAGTVTVCVTVCALGAESCAADAALLHDTCWLWHAVTDSLCVTTLTHCTCWTSQAALAAPWSVLKDWPCITKLPLPLALFVTGGQAPPSPPLKLKNVCDCWMMMIVVLPPVAPWPLLDPPFAAVLFPEPAAAAAAAAAVLLLAVAAVLLLAAAATEVPLLAAAAAAAAAAAVVL